MTEYIIGPVGQDRGLCKTCGCHLQEPYWPESDGSIWLTPWHDNGGHCTVCMAHGGDPDACAALEEWLWLTKAAAEKP